MKKILTEIGVKRMKPPASDSIDVFDQSYPALHLRVSSHGAKSWGFYYRINGRQRRMTLGQWPQMSLSAAHDAWRAAREDVSCGRDPARLRRRQETATAFEV